MSSKSNEHGASSWQVVVNDEGQYSIWPDNREVAAGWRSVVRAMSRADCLAYIEREWTDMRPASLRKSMEQFR